MFSDSDLGGFSEIVCAELTGSSDCSAESCASGPLLNAVSNIDRAVLVSNIDGTVPIIQKLVVKSETNLTNMYTRSIFRCNDGNTGSTTSCQTKNFKNSESKNIKGEPPVLSAQENQLVVGNTTMLDLMSLNYASESQPQAADLPKDYPYQGFNPRVPFYQNIMRPILYNLYHEDTTTSGRRLHNSSGDLKAMDVTSLLYNSYLQNSQSVKQFQNDSATDKTSQWMPVPANCVPPTFTGKLKIPCVPQDCSPPAGDFVRINFVRCKSTTDEMQTRVDISFVCPSFSIKNKQMVLGPDNTSGLPSSAGVFTGIPAATKTNTCSFQTASSMPKVINTNITADDWRSVNTCDSGASPPPAGVSKTMPTSWWSNYHLMLHEEMTNPFQPINLSKYDKYQQLGCRGICGSKYTQTASFSFTADPDNIGAIFSPFCNAACDQNACPAGSNNGLCGLGSANPLFIPVPQARRLGYRCLGPCYTTDAKIPGCGNRNTSLISLETVMEREVNTRLFDFVCDIFADTERQHQAWVKAPLKQPRNLLKVVRRYRRVIPVECPFMRLHFVFTLRVAFIADQLRAGLYPTTSAGIGCSTAPFYVGTTLDSPFLYEPVTDMRISVKFEEIPNRLLINPLTDRTFLTDNGNLCVYKAEETSDKPASPCLYIAPIPTMVLAFIDPGKPSAKTNIYTEINNTQKDNNTLWKPWFKSLLLSCWDMDFCVDNCLLEKRYIAEGDTTTNPASIMSRIDHYMTNYVIRIFNNLPNFQPENANKATVSVLNNSTSPLVSGKIGLPYKTPCSTYPSMTVPSWVSSGPTTGAYSPLVNPLDWNTAACELFKGNGVDDSCKIGAENIQNANFLPLFNDFKSRTLSFLTLMNIQFTGYQNFMACKNQQFEKINNSSKEISGCSYESFRAQLFMEVCSGSSAFRDIQSKPIGTIAPLLNLPTSCTKWGSMCVSGTDTKDYLANAVGSLIHDVDTQMGYGSGKVLLNPATPGIALPPAQVPKNTTSSTSSMYAASPPQPPLSTCTGFVDPLANSNVNSSYFSICTLCQTPNDTNIQPLQADVTLETEFVSGTQTYPFFMTIDKNGETDHITNSPNNRILTNADLYNRSLYILYTGTSVWVDGDCEDSKICTGLLKDQSVYGDTWNSGQYVNYLNQMDVIVRHLQSIDEQENLVIDLPVSLLRNWSEIDDSDKKYNLYHCLLSRNLRFWTIFYAGETILKKQNSSKNQNIIYNKQIYNSASSWGVYQNYYHYPDLQRSLSTKPNLIDFENFSNNFYNFTRECVVNAFQTEKQNAPGTTVGCNVLDTEDNAIIQIITSTTNFYGQISGQSCLKDSESVLILQNRTIDPVYFLVQGDSDITADTDSNKSILCWTMQPFQYGTLLHILMQNAETFTMASNMFCNNRIAFLFQDVKEQRIELINLINDMTSENSISCKVSCQSSLLSLINNQQSNTNNSSPTRTYFCTCSGSTGTINKLSDYLTQTWTSETNDTICIVEPVPPTTGSSGNNQIINNVSVCCGDKQCKNSPPGNQPLSPLELIGVIIGSSIGGVILLIGVIVAIVYAANNVTNLKKLKT